MTNIIELCKQGFDPKALGSLNEIEEKAKDYQDKETKIINETELIDKGNKRIYYLYVKE